MTNATDTLDIRTRPYGGDADLPAMRALRLACAAAGSVPPAFTVAEIRTFLGSPQRYAPDDTCLWEQADGALAAFALLWDGPNLAPFIHPAARGGGLEAAIAEWAIERAAAHRHGGLPVEVWVRLQEDDSKFIRALTDRGFVREEWQTVYLTRRLDAPLPMGALPGGFAIRAVTGEQEADAYVALYREATGSARMTVVERLATMRDARYRRDLDLVAVSPDGILAAFCSCHIDEEENAATGRREGWTDPIGTRPAFRRRGLMRALLLEGCRRLRDHGLDLALLGTAGENLPAQQAAASAGYERAFAVPAYVRRL